MITILCPFVPIHCRDCHFVSCRNHRRSPRLSRNYRVSGKHGDRADSVRDSNKVSSLRGIARAASNLRVCRAENFHPPALSCRDSPCPSRKTVNADCVMRCSPGRKMIIRAKGNRVRKMKLAGALAKVSQDGTKRSDASFRVLLYLFRISFIVNSNIN